MPHIELRAKREVTPPFDMSTAYRQANFRDRPEYALSPRVAAETPNGGTPNEPHTSCDGGEFWRLSLLAGDHTATSFFLARLPP